MSDRSAHRRGILIDLDGVVRIWPGTHRPVAGDERATVEHALGAIAFGPDLLPLAITGAIDDPTWRREIERRLNIDWPDHAADAIAAWSAMRPPIDERVRDLIRRWRRTVPVVLVTNATSRLAADLKDLAIGDLFDATINSSEVGHAKPDARIFQAALDRIGVKPAGVMFIDDTAANVAAAVEIGLTGYHYTGEPDALATMIEDWLVGDTATATAAV